MINYVASDLIRTTQTRLRDSRLTSIDDVRERARPLASFSPEVRTENLQLKTFLSERLYRHHKVLRMTSKARRVLKELFRHSWTTSS